jgi:hypothetical protein
MTRTASLCPTIMFACLLLSVGLAQTTPAAEGPAPIGNNPDPTSDGLARAPATPCSSDIVFTRRLRYEKDDVSTLDLAGPEPKAGSKRPIVMFFTAEPAGVASAPSGAFEEAAMCFAAEHGLLAVHARYPDETGRHPGHATKRVAAAISWVFDNADLFRGNADEIVPIGFGANAAPLVDLLLGKIHLEHANVAGMILASIAFDPEQRSSDLSTGMSGISMPVLLAWSSADDAVLRSANEKFRDSLCAAGHCPRTAVLGPSGNVASVFDLDGTNADLHERLRQLIGQLDARGLP